MIYKLMVILGSLTFSLACKQQEQTPFYHTCLEGDHEIGIYHLSAYTDTLSPLLLSDITEDLRFVPLETTDSCLVQLSQLLIGEKYIVTSGENAILLFDREGRFLRRIAVKGRGPGEYEIIRKMVFNPEEDKIFAIEMSDHRIHCWDFVKQSYFSIPIPQGFANDLQVFDDSTLVVSYSRVPYSKYKLCVLNTDGSMRYNLPNLLHEDEKRSSGANMFYRLPGEILYQPHFSDSVYCCTKDTILLKYVFPKKEEEQVTLNMITENYIYCSLFIPRKSEKLEKKDINGKTYYVTRTYGDYYAYQIDRKTHQPVCYRNVENDFTGKLDGYGMMMSWGTGRLVYNIYYPSGLISKLPEILQDKDLSTAIRKRLEKLYARTREGDNPILLIGKQREKSFDQLP